MASIHTACRCGAVTIDIDALPIAQFYCHCDDCRAVTGGAFTAIALYPKDAVTIGGGETFTWTLKTLPRTRCRNCGTLLFGEPPGLGMVGVMGFLLPADAFAPTFHSQCRFAVLEGADELPHFAGLPPQFGGSDARVGW